MGRSPWGREESDTTEQLHFHFSLSCIGEGNGNPLQCSCLENPGHGGAWWAAIYGVAQSQTRLKPLSSSSSSSVGVEQILTESMTVRGTERFTVIPAIGHIRLSSLALRGQPRGRHRRLRFDSWVGKIPWSRTRKPTSISFPENSIDRVALQATVHGVTTS